jgi:L,D-transpeptidase YcbB
MKYKETRSWRIQGTQARSSAMRNAYQLRVVLLLVLAPALSLHASSTRELRDPCEAISARAAQSAEPDAAAQLCSLIESGHLEELRWPDCSSYRDQVHEFYLPAGYALAWTQQGRPTPQARAVIELFRAAEEKGLEAEDYDASRWPGRLESLSGARTSAQDLARFDFALTVSVLRYLSDLNHGRVSPRECQFDLPAQPFNAAQLLRKEILNAGDVKAAAAQVEPPFDGYRRALALLQRYNALAREADEELPAITKPLHPGNAYSGTALLAHRLRRLGDLSPDAAPASPEKYQGPLVAAIVKFQQRHGLQPDGVIGRATWEQLAMPLSRRVLQIKLALERWRWLPRNAGPRVMVVNLPEFRLRGYENHRVAITMRAIVGGAMGHQTPVFADKMESLIFHPYWNVPESILKKEIVPRLRRDPGYLARHKMELVDHQQGAVPAAHVDTSVLQQLASGKLRVRQQPGPANSLGLLKFVFPNKFGVYIHGTPQRELFFQPRRDFSHGCIRVEDPAALAAWVLRDRPEWTAERIVAAMSAKKPQTVPLRAPVPVLILYSTVFVEESGEALFFQDIYGHDAVLEKMLSLRR